MIPHEVEGYNTCKNCHFPYTVFSKNGWCPICQQAYVLGRMGSTDRVVTRECENPDCKKTFESRNNARFCQISCRKSAKNKRRKAKEQSKKVATCLWEPCSKKFHPESWQQTTCSDECLENLKKQRADRRREYEKEYRRRKRAESRAKNEGQIHAR